MGIEILVNLIESIMIIGFINAVLKPKYSRRTMVFALVLYIVTNVILVTFINRTVRLESYTVIIFILCAYLYVAIIYKDSMLKKVFVVAIPFCIIGISSMITASFVSSTFNVSIIETLNYTTDIRYISLFVAKLLQGIITVLGVMIIKKHIVDLKSSQWVHFIVLFTISFFCTVFIFNIQVSDSEVFRFEMFVLATTCLLILNVAILLIFINLSHRQKELLELKLNETKMIERIRAEEDLEEAVLQLQKLRHDIKDQYVCVQSLIKDGCLEEARIHLEKLTDNIEYDLAQTSLIRTPYLSLNAVLNYFLRKSSESKIILNHFIYEIQIGEIDEYYLCSLVSNLLNNAVDASVNLKGANIQLKMYNKANYLICYVSNNIELSALERGMQTTKLDKKLHGYGMKIIEDIVKKYDGISRFEEVDNRFIAEIWLKIHV